MVAASKAAPKKRREIAGYMTLAEAAGIIGITSAAMYYWCRDGKVKSLKLGRYRYIEKDSLIGYVGADAANALGLLPKGKR